MCAVLWQKFYHNITRTIKQRWPGKGQLAGNRDICLFWEVWQIMEMGRSFDEKEAGISIPGHPCGGYSSTLAGFRDGSGRNQPG